MPTFEPVDHDPFAAPAASALRYEPVDYDPFAGSIEAPGGMDAAFASLPADQGQNQALVAEGRRRAGLETGGWNNLTAGLNDAIYTVAGAPVDAATWVLNQAGKQARAISGAPVQEIQPGFGGSQSIAGWGERVGVNDPSKVVAATPGEEVARAAGAGIGYAVAPEAMVAGLGRAGAISERAVNAVAPFIGRSATAGDVAANAFVGGVSGAGAEFAGDALPEQYRPLAEFAGGMLAGGAAAGLTAVPGLVGAGVRAAGDYLPVTARGQERTAAQTLQREATNPYGVREALDTERRDLTPGSRPTTAQLTGDMGLAGYERGVATRDPVVFNERRAEQNSARREALDGVMPQSGSENVVAALRQGLADIDARTSTAVEAATAHARSRAGALGGVGTPEGYGENLLGFAQPRVDQARATAREATDALGRTGAPEAYGATSRDALRQAEEVARAREDALWKAVDPDGTLALPAGNTRKGALEIARGQPKTAKPISGEERAIFLTAARQPEVMKFSDMAALRSRVSTAMRKERVENGRTPVYARLSQLRALIEQDIEQAVVARAAQEADAVASGAMAEESALLARLSGWRNGWKEEQAARGAIGSSVGPDGSGGTGGFSTSRRTAGEVRGGFPDASSAEGIPGPGLQPNFDEAAAARLNLATDATRSRAETFGKGPVGNVLRSEGTRGPYNIADAAVPARFFKPGPGGYETVQAFRKAAGDDGALVSLQDYAVTELRRIATRDDGTLDPTKAAAWVRQHADALRAFPELRGKLGNAREASRLLDESRFFPDGTPNAEVASRVFKPGPAGYEAATKFLDTVGEPRARSVVQDYALSTLRTAAERPDGTLDPAKVAQWRHKHANALRAFPEIDRMLADPVRASETMETVAIQRKAALDNYQAGVTAKLIGLEDPSDIARTVGGIFGRQDATRQMAALRQKIGSNEEAKEGLKKGIADYITQRFISNTEAATSEETLLKSDAFQTFMRQSIPALKAAGFTDKQVEVMRFIAADLQRANRSLTAAKIPGGSNTAQDTISSQRKPGNRTFITRFVEEMGAGLPATGIAGLGFTVGGGWGAALGAGLGWLGAKGISAMRKAGLEKADDIIKDAMLNPERAKTLFDLYPPKPTPKDELRISQRYKRAIPAALGLGDQEGGNERTP